MPKFRMEIDTSNAAFEDNPEELTTLIVETAGKVAHGQLTGKIADSNGNTVGEFSMNNIVSKENHDNDIQVQRMYRFQTDRPLKAFVDIIINDALLVKGVRVMEGKKGLYVSMPREMAQDKKWYDTVRCLTEEVRDEITKVVFEAYNEE